MTKEALKMALEALEEPKEHFAKHRRLEAITDIKETLAQPEQDNTYGYASRLATAIWQKHYMEDAPKWKPLNTTEGVLTQIDNMTCGLVKEKPSQPEQEPVAWMSDQDVGFKKSEFGATPTVPLYTTQPQRTWVGLTDDERDEICLGDESIARSIEAMLREKNTRGQE